MFLTQTILSIWAIAVSVVVAATTGATAACVENATRLHLPDPPYDNYFYSDCHSSSHIIVTTPLPTSNLSVIGPRLLIAWPSGNSGIVAFFEPENGVNGSLAVTLEAASAGGEVLNPIYESAGSKNPRVGVSGSIKFNSSAVLTIPILGSIRTIRDFTEGPSIIYPSVQEKLVFATTAGGGATVNRTWFDNSTTTYLSFVPLDGAVAVSVNREENTTLHFGSGVYQFDASFDYPQLTQLSQEQVLNNASLDLIAQKPDQTKSLSFLSYTGKLLAGTWRFLTYFGRDSMISLLLLQPVLSEGEGGAIEAVIGSVLERVNRTDGSACHEEVLGDYATFLNAQKNITSNAPGCDYKMIDTDFFLPIVMQNYLIDTEAGRTRSSIFLNKTASFLAANEGFTYRELAQATADKIMRITAPFACDGGQTKTNLIHLKEGEIVGEWRDSTYGIGGGRIPYDVNTALVPAALRSISALSNAGVFPSHPDWATLATQYAKVWEDETLRFFRVSVPATDAKSLVETYIDESNYTGPPHLDEISSEETAFYAVALDGNNNQSIVRVMNTDDCFRLFLLNTTNQSQLGSFLEQVAEHILQPFPIGLSSDVGLFVANPAYGGDPVYAKNFTNADYHGTVVWSWPLAIMAKGLERQLGRCTASSSGVADFCSDATLYDKVLSAYNHLWDLIDKNSAQLSSEVWSWTYDNGFQVKPLGALTATESDIRQLWSLTFLAVQRRNFTAVQ